MRYNRVDLWQGIFFDGVKNPAWKIRTGYLYENADGLPGQRTDAGNTLGVRDE
jgi:hypothetical protein